MRRFETLPADVRPAFPEELAAVATFYAENGYTPTIGATDAVMIAMRQGQVIGVCRVATEEGHLVLRGMRVAEGFRRRGIATSLLHAVEVSLSMPCFCLPFSHLIPLYAGAGFSPVGNDKLLPAFLAARATRYRAKGESITPMLRDPGGVFA